MVELSSLDDLLSVEEVALRLYLHPESVRRKAREGTLPAYRIGRRWVFSEREMLALMDRPVYKLDTTETRPRGKAFNGQETPKDDSDFLDC
jgi:excisionase family DNA binding protein